MGEGFLGTNASIMLDVVVCSLVLVVPTLLYSLWLVKFRKQYAVHKRIQLVLCGVLLVVVALFEIDMRLQGGFYEMAKESPYIETAFLKRLLWVHLAFSISTVFLWAATLITAMKGFDTPPRPNKFSPRHKVLAWIAVIDMVATVVTGLMVYYYGFVAG